MNSSYIKNDYGSIFYDLIVDIKPEIIIEAGVLDGYSLINIGKALKTNNKGFVIAYDLWENYNYRHGDKEEVQKEIDKEDLDEYIFLFSGNILEVSEEYHNNDIDILHIDISNTGSTIKEVINHWHNKVKLNGYILFEGGSKERDQVEWMIKYNKPSLQEELIKNNIIREKYVGIIFQDFPSLTLLRKIKE